MKRLLVLGLLLIACSRYDDYSDRPPDIEPLDIVRDVPGYDFFWPMSIAADSGRVFIADFRDNCIHVFDESLAHIDTIGRKGEGPGEFEALINISAKNGFLAALNIAPPRISLFDYQGNPIREIHVDITRWGDIAITDRNTIMLARYFRGSDSFISEYSLEGEVVREFLEHPSTADFYTSLTSQCRLRYQDSQGYIVFEQVPRIMGFGEKSFDISHEITIAFPRFSRAFKMRKKLDRKYGGRAFAMLSIYGGFEIVDEHLIIAGPGYDLMVLNLLSDTLHHINMGSQGWELSTQHQLTEIKRSSTMDGGRRGTDSSGANTYWDAQVIGDEIWMLSTMNSCLVKFRISDILETAEPGIAMQAQQYIEQR